MKALTFSFVTINPLPSPTSPASSRAAATPATMPADSMTCAVISVTRLIR